MRHLYTILFYLATPLILLRLWLKSRRNAAYGLRWRERFGLIPLINNDKSIWLHAVSLGESIAATPLITALLNHYPDYHMVVTTTTPTGAAEITKHFGQKVTHYYAPYDLPAALRRFLKQVHPKQVIIMERELWPNLLHALKQQNIPTMIANARLSERSMLKYLRLRHFFQPLLQSVYFSAQSKADAERFHAIGADKHKITVCGNIKFDYPLPEQLIEQGRALRQHWQQRPTLIAASTHEGEETLLLEAFRKIRAQHPNALLILVPRHPERFTKVADLCRKLGFTLACRSKEELPQDTTAVYLADTMGELKLLYAASDVAFVGGSLVPIGGHNLIEPASLSLPILSGPNLQNFVAIRDMLEDSDALLITENSATIAEQVNRLFSEENLRHQFGARALSISEQNRGAIARHINLLNLQLASPNTATT